MSGGGQRLREVLDGYGKFLRKEDSTPAKHLPHPAGRAEKLLLFAREHAGYHFEQTRRCRCWPVQQCGYRGSED
jgi:hypothetical protein